MAGPILSAAQPNTTIPSMADDMAPVLKILKTRAIISFGVSSWRDAATTGMTIAAPAPMISTQNTAMKGFATTRMARMARPSSTAAIEISQTRLQSACWSAHASQADVMSMPTPNADQIKPSCVAPTCRTFLAITGNRKIKPVDPRLYRATMIIRSRAMRC